MATRRILKGVLHNFLGTFVSRNSDHGGYWIFGFVVADFAELDFDLLSPEIDLGGASILAAIQGLARTRFRAQLERAGIDPSSVREARLTIRRQPGDVQVRVGEHTSVGSQLRFITVAQTDLGTTYRCEKTISVAPHNCLFERRRA